MPNTATVTGKTGPDVLLTARVFTDPRQINFDLAHQVLSVQQADGKVVEFDLYVTTTVTYAIAGRLATVTVTNA